MNDRDWQLIGAAALILGVLAAWVVFLMLLVFW